MSTHESAPSLGTLAKGHAILLAALGGLVLVVGIGFLALGGSDDTSTGGDGPDYAALIIIALGLLLLNGALTVWAVVAGVRIARDDRDSRLNRP